MKGSRKAQNKKGKRTYSRGAIYFCGRCFYFSWLDASKIQSDMWNPSPSIVPINRTCDKCRAAK